MEVHGLSQPKTPLLDGISVAQKRAEIKAYYIDTWETYEDLFQCIRHEAAYYQRPEPLRHPLIFYLGHTATFFINKLILGQYIEQRINPSFESMFAVGVDEMSWDDLDSQHYDWPKVSEVKQYRMQVRRLVERLIDEMPLELPIHTDSLAWTLLMGIEHERIHLETSSVLIRMLPLSDVQPSPRWSACPRHGEAPANALQAISGGTVTLGRANHTTIYGWDNEFGSQQVQVAPFAASRYLVSNQEFLAFVEAQGYTTPSYWCEEGQAWLQFSQAQMPRFWVRKADGYWQRNMVEEIPLPLNWPVEVNYFEAKAFCEWKTAQLLQPIRLPTEAEWTLMRNLLDGDAPDWEQAPGNINLEYYASSCPIDEFAQDQFYDLVGNVWQWTESTMDAYPGFHVHKLYDDFSTPTFDGRHNLIKGGSWISTGNLATRHARYAFRRHFFQHAGFRYVQSDTPVETQTTNTYETDTAISQYLEFHYGDSYFSVPNFPEACIALAKRYYQTTACKRALDLGCSVGRSSFIIARDFAHVDALDFSARFIQQAVRLQQTGRLHYTIATEGDLVEYKEYLWGSLNNGETPPSHVNFMQGDACNLKDQFRDYDLIFCGNLIDRLYDPAKFLTKVHERVRPHGILILTSPYTWLEAFTEKTHWLGGIKRDGESVTTLQGLKQALSEHFTLIAQHDIPFVIRETARKFQHSVAEMTVWQRK